MLEVEGAYVMVAAAVMGHSLVNLEEWQVDSLVVVGVGC
jgi:hypothetical protein